MSSIHTNLKELRTEKGLTQEEVGNRIGLTRQALSAYESGKRQPGIDILVKLAEIYEVDIETILYRQQRHSGKRRVKRIAIVVAAIFLSLQLLAGVLFTLSAVLYPIEEGPVPHDQIETLAKHIEMSKQAETSEKFAAFSLTLGSMIVLIFDLSVRMSFSWKQKLAFFLTILAASWIIAIVLSMVHPVYGIITFITIGPIHLISAAVLLLVDLIISAMRQKQRV